MDRPDIGNKNLGQLDGGVYIEAKRHLNISTSTRNGWRAIVSVLDGEYKLKPDEIAEISNSECPATALLIKLGSLMMTIDEFASYIAKTEDHRLMSIFNVHVDIQILEHPISQFVGVQGDPMCLSVRATGFPRPRYQWLKNQQWLTDACSRHYQCESITKADEGIYSCLIFQDLDSTNHEFSKPAVVRVLPAPDLEIRQHPRIKVVTRGKGAAFHKVTEGCDVHIGCEVYGPRNMTFQWFRNGIALGDHERVRGSNSSVMHLYGVGRSEIGCYHCRVSAGNQILETKGVPLQIHVEQGPCSQAVYTATDKVALLIGCGDYIGDAPLKAPSNDVETLASILQCLNFKVVSLINLKRNEIIAAVHEFSQLVGTGVYCLFYFCGHGFEAAGQVFLVPVDAPQAYQHDNCISADCITSVLLERDPRLITVILDVCRKERKVDLVRNLSSIYRPPVRSATLITVYATSYGMSAYEDYRHGIVVSHLKNYLSLPVSVEEVFRMFREAISNDKTLKEREKIQNPQVLTNLIESKRSLTDPILYAGFTTAFNERREAWEAAHKVPESRIIDVRFSYFTIKVQVDFRQVCSNVLYIFTTIIDAGPAVGCYAWVSGIPVTVAEKSQIVALTLRTSQVKLYNIHRLREDMTITLDVTCKDPKEHQTVTISDLPRPLISVLRLWEDRPDFTLAPPQDSLDDGDESSISSQRSLTSGAESDWGKSLTSSMQSMFINNSYKAQC